MCQINISDFIFFQIYTSIPTAKMRFGKIALNIESGVKTFLVLTPFWQEKKKYFIKIKDFMYKYRNKNLEIRC